MSDQTTGAPVETQEPAPVAQEPKVEYKPQGEPTDSVSYETHRRLLSEKKRVAEQAAELRAKVEQYEAAQKARQEEELLAEKKYQDLLKLREEELATERAKAAELQERQVNAMKLNKVLDALPGNLPSTYWMHINTNKVLINPDSGDVDPSSVQSVVKEFMDEHHRLLDNPVPQAKVDPSAPQQPAVGQISASEWQKMPPADQLKNIGNVEGAEDWMAQGHYNQKLKV